MMTFVPSFSQSTTKLRSSAATEVWAWSYRGLAWIADPLAYTSLTMPIESPRNFGVTSGLILYERDRIRRCILFMDNTAQFCRGC